MKGLGRGLGALLVNSEEEYDGGMFSEKKAAHGAPTEIPIEQIEPNINQPRKVFEESAMMELVNSIRIHGVISPIIVVRNDFEKYMIIAGERRWRACKHAGLKTIPAIVRDYSQKQIKEISLIDNLQRENLNPIETAKAIKELMDEYKYTQDEVAERIGKSRPAVANTLRLLTLYPPVIELVASGRLSAGHARCLVTVTKHEDQLALAQKGCDDKLSVRDFEKLVKNYLSPKKTNLPQREQSVELKDLVDRMQHIYATKVSILGNDHKGRIYIDYFTKDDLDRISEMMDLLKDIKIN